MSPKVAGLSWDILKFRLSTSTNSWAFSILLGLRSAISSFRLVRPSFMFFEIMSTMTTWRLFIASPLLEGLNEKLSLVYRIVDKLGASISTSCLIRWPLLESLLFDPERLFLPVRNSMRSPPSGTLWSVLRYSNSEWLKPPRKVLLSD